MNHILPYAFPYLFMGVLTLRLGLYCTRNDIPNAQPSVVGLFSLVVIFLWPMFWGIVLVVIMCTGLCRLPRFIGTKIKKWNAQQSNPE